MYLDLMQGKLETKAHPLTRGKGQPGTCPAPLISHPPTNTRAYVAAWKLQGQIWLGVNTGNATLRAFRRRPSAPLLMTMQLIATARANLDGHSGKMSLNLTQRSCSS